MKKILSILLCVGFLSSLLACGYSFQGSGSILPTNIKKIFVKDVVNNTIESAVGLIFTEALNDRFDRYGTFTVVDKESEADAVLTAEILDITRDTRSVTSGTDTALQLETTVQISANLTSKAGLLLWSNPAMVLSDTFGTAASSVVSSSADFAAGGLNASDLVGLNAREVSRDQEGQILEELLETAAKRVYEAAVLPEF